MVPIDRWFFHSGGQVSLDNTSLGSLDDDRFLVCFPVYAYVCAIVRSVHSHTILVHIHCHGTCWDRCEAMFFTLLGASRGIVFPSLNDNDTLIPSYPIPSYPNTSHPNTLILWSIPLSVL